MLKTRFLKEKGLWIRGFKLLCIYQWWKNTRPKSEWFFPKLWDWTVRSFCTVSTVSLSWKRLRCATSCQLSNLMVEDNSEWMTVTWICATMIQSHWRSYHVRRVKLDKMITNVQVRLLMEKILHHLRLVVYPIIYKVWYIPGGFWWLGDDRFDFFAMALRGVWLFLFESPRNPSVKSLADW